MLKLILQKFKEDSLKQNSKKVLSIFFILFSAWHGAYIDDLFSIFLIFGVLFLVQIPQFYELFLGKDFVFKEHFKFKKYFEV